MNAHADRVLVDTDLNDQGDDVFVIKHGGETLGEPWDDPLAALHCAEEMARQLGCKCDLTIQARNAADMS